MQEEMLVPDFAGRIESYDLSSLVALRVIASRSADGEWLSLRDLLGGMRSEYARLSASPRVPMSDTAPPWETVSLDAAEGAHEYLLEHVVRRLVADGLLETEALPAPDGDPRLDTLRLRGAALDGGEVAPALSAIDARILELLDDAQEARPAAAARSAAHGEVAELGGSTLTATHLVKAYRKRRVVNDVDLHVSQGEIVGLLGPNGAGKTTTFYMMVGLIGPDEGTVRIGDENVTSVPMYRRARKGIGYLAQEPSVFRKLTVEENILAILQMLGLPKKEQRARLEELLDELGIRHLRASKAYSLSGGERRRLEITRALVGRPKFMLLDEPFAGVDPIAVHDIQQIVADLRRRNIGVLISDHNVEQTLDIVDRAYIMYDGRVRVSGTVSELVWNEEVAEIYLGPTLTARMRQRYPYPA